MTIDIMPNHVISQTYSLVSAVMRAKARGAMYVITLLHRSLHPSHVKTGSYQCPSYSSISLGAMGLGTAAIDEIEL